MQTPSSTSPVSPIPIPQIDSDEPVAVIPVASVAPPEGEPLDGRINTFALAPARSGRAGTARDTATLDALREHAHARPLACVAAAFALGFVVARILR